MNIARAKGWRSVGILLDGMVANEWVYMGRSVSKMALLIDFLEIFFVLSPCQNPTDFGVYTPWSLIYLPVHLIDG